MSYEPKYLPTGEPNPLWRSQAGRKKPRNTPRKNSSEYDKDRKRSGKSLTLFESGVFVGIDGEGADIENQHRYIMLSSSTGKRITSLDGLPSTEIFNYLLDLGKETPKGIFCIYGGSYDFNFWLKDLPKEKIEKIVENDGKAYVVHEGYAIRMVQRKFFAVKKWAGIQDEKDKGVLVWDVIGFFQSAFVGAIKQWIPDYPKLDLIIEGKSRRSDFKESELDFIADYTDAELDALVQLMEKLRQGIKDLGLQIKGWHGAGAIATAMLTAHNTKKVYAELPKEVYEASKHAYFGGRIEIGKYGRHNGTVYHYDINSAYPAGQRFLPALAGGHWINRGKNYDPRSSRNVLIISLVKWSDFEDEPFNPFPYRSWAQMKVLFPSAGYNWIWKPELAAALDAKEKYGKERWQIEIEDSWEFIPDPNAPLPFEWIPEYYETRQKIVAESKRTKKPNGQEKAIKLGISSLYGKQAQRVGYDEKKLKAPPYHNLAYAGWITSYTRATLYTAAMQAPDKIICLSTDGIYSQVPLDLNCPKEKILGEWDYQMHDEMTLIQSGVYFLRDGDELTCYSRGFDKFHTPEGIKEAYDIIIDGWRNKHYNIRLACTRFITLKSALIGGDWWDRWLTWYEFVDKKTGEKGRSLKLSPVGSKRDPIIEYKSKKCRPDLEMQNTLPLYNLTPYVISDQHNIPWDDLKEEGEPDDSIVADEHSIGYI